MANTKNVLEAKRLCHEVQQALTQSFQTFVAQKQAELSNSETKNFPILDLTGKGEGFKVNKDLYELFLTEKLSTTNSLLGGMPQAIDSFINEEMSKRGLDTLKTTFL